MTVGTTAPGSNGPDELYSPAPAQVVVGRTAELAVVRDLLDLAAGGQGQVVLVEGEAGIGKTTVVDEVARMAQALGAQVTFGEADEFDARRPFGVLAKALAVTMSAPDPALAGLARVLMRGEGAGEDHDDLSKPGLTEYRVGEAILDRVERLSTEVPLVLIVENLQWVDPSSLGCLRRLIPTVPGRPIFVLLTSRPIDRRPELLRLLECSGAVRRLRLAPLEKKDVAYLAAQSVGAAPGPALARELERAGGNPLFVTELLRVLVARRLLRPTAPGEIDLEQVFPSTSLSMTILHRISLLPPETLDLVRLGAVLGPSFSAAELSALSGRSGVELMSPIEDAIGAGVLWERDGRLCFRHELVYQTLYEDIPLSLRSTLHRETGLRLAGQGAPAGLVAEHLARGAEAGDREAARWLRQAGREELSTSPPLAVGHLSQAVGLSSAHDRPPVEADLALALIWSGRNAEGEALVRDLAGRLGDPVVMDRLSHAMAASLLMRGRVGEAREFARASRARGTLDMSSELMAQCVEAITSLFLGDRVSAERLARSALAAGQESGDAMVAGSASVVLSLVETSNGHLSSALDHASEGQRLAIAIPMADVRMGLPHLVLATVMMELDRLAEARAYLWEGRRRAELVGSRISVASYHISLGYNEYLAGSWDDALAETATGLAEAEESAAGWRVDALAIRAAIEAQRGLRDQARADMAEAQARMQAGEPAVHLEWLLPAQALLREASGDAAGALGALREAWDLASSAGLPLVHLEVGQHLARLSLAFGDEVGARRTADVVRALASANPGVERLDAIACWCEQLTGSDADALAEVAARIGRGARPLERALAHEDAAHALAVAGRCEQARHHAEAAIAGYEDMQASSQLVRARARLRRAGVRLGPRASRRRATSGWGALSATELRVAGLVGEGLSNVEIAAQLFLSRRTVETHVAHILAKLPCPSKRQLASLAARRLPAQVLREPKDLL
jgi:DNA-binding CsgD family transcriptional regulator